MKRIFLDVMDAFEWALEDLGVTDPVGRILAYVILFCVFVAMVLLVMLLLLAVGNGLGMLW